MKRPLLMLVVTIGCITFWGVFCLWAGSTIHAQTEPAPAPPAQTAPQQPTAEQQATAVVGQAVQGFLLYAPTTEAQRKLVIDSLNTVKAAMDRLAALEKPATEAPTP